MRSAVLLYILMAGLFCEASSAAAPQDRLDVWLPLPERFAAAPYSHQTGLKGEYWHKTVYTNGQAERTCRTRKPDAVFHAGRIDFPAGTGLPADEMPLTRFLGADGASLRGNSKFTNLYGLFRFSGTIQITKEMDLDPKTPEIEVIFGLASDDGARLKIGGETVISHNGGRYYTRSSSRVRFGSPGVYPIEILFYDCYGWKSGISLYSSFATEARSEAPEGTHGIVPESVLAPELPNVRQFARLITGWHDEFNEPHGWRNMADGRPISSARTTHGALRIRLGQRRAGDQHTRRRSGVYQDLTIDLDRYPILAVKTSRLTLGASWEVRLIRPGDESAGSSGTKTSPHANSHMSGLARQTVDDQTNSGENSGRSILRAGMRLLDVRSSFGIQGAARVRLILNLSGPAGSQVNYAWVRFLSREEAARLQSRPNINKVEFAP